jgi:cobaltochelatase CobS
MNNINLIDAITLIDRKNAELLCNNRNGKPVVRPPTPLINRPENKPDQQQKHASVPIGNMRSRHEAFGLILPAIKAGINVFLVGPAGSGKTTCVAQVAECLSLKFYFNGAIQSEYKLTGFRDAHGRVHRTAFRNAFENGGVYLFDEIDVSQPAALLAFNAALANGVFDFPDRTIRKHRNFRCIAAANTWGKGATLEYVGRNALDGATLDRFAMVEMNYDHRLEREIALSASNSNTELAEAWLQVVWAAREATQHHQIRHIISPRATKDGLSLMVKGLIFPEYVSNMVIRRGLDETSWRRIASHIGVNLNRVSELAEALPKRHNNESNL